MVDESSEHDGAELLFGFMDPTVQTVITNQLFSEVEIFKEDYIENDDEIDMENKLESI